MFAALVVLLHTLLIGSSVLFWHDKFQAALVPAVKQEAAVAPADTLTLLFVGDIMLDRGVEWHAKQHNDWGWPFRSIAHVLQDADLVFGNLESVISNKGTKQGSIYSFRANPKTLGALKFAGFDIVSVANNHSFDYGADALLDSIQRLAQAGITSAGAGNNQTEARAPALKTIQGTTIAILAYSAVGSPLWQASQFTPGIAWMDASLLLELAKDIRAAQKKSDITIVSFHFGQEYQATPTPLQQLLSKAAIDAGADLVVGHHSHVVQPLERYKNGWIAYGLGNFVFDQAFSKETMEGMLLEVQVKQKRITSVLPFKITISKESQPAISKESM
jgi:poly-gamma-glutamate capsule biosynthesis protein CapA/YwtB (metallophosphatase superfamily)